MRTYTLSLVAFHLTLVVCPRLRLQRPRMSLTGAVRGGAEVFLDMGSLGLYATQGRPEPV